MEIALQQQDDDARPELADTDLDLSAYDTVFIGYPIWYGYEPMIIRTFLESYDFSGKTVIPFVTHGGGGMAGCERDMRKICPKAAFGKGGAFSGRGVRNAEEALRKWVDEVVTVRK